MNTIFPFIDKLIKIMKNKLQHTKTTSKIITVLLVLLLIIQCVGYAQKDPYHKAVEEWTEKMPDEVAAAYAEIIGAGISALPNSPLFYSCLGSQAQFLPDYVANSQGLGWNNVSTTAQLKRLLFKNKFIDFLDQIDLAVGNCGAMFGEGHDPYIGMIDQLLREQEYINNLSFDELSGSSPDTHELYLACMAEMEEHYRNSACHPLADDGGWKTTADFTDEPLVVEGSPPSDSNSANDSGTSSSPSNSPDSNSGSGNTPGESEAAGGGTTVNRPIDYTDPDGRHVTGQITKNTTPEGDVIIDVEVTVSGETEKRNNVTITTTRDIVKGALGSIIAAGVVLVLLPELAATAAITAGAVVMMFVVEQVVELVVEQIHDFVFENSIPKMCPPMSGEGVMDNRLPAGHELMGKNYQIGGVEPGPAEQYDSCNCLWERTNPLTSWGCQSEADQRRDCILNPYGPDDAPRPECMDLLYEDVGADPSPMCFFDCPEGYSVTTSCTCGNPSAEDALIIGDSCLTMICPEGAVQIDPQTGVCGCPSGDAAELCENPPFCDEGVVPTPPDPCENPPFCDGGLP